MQALILRNVNYEMAQTKIEKVFLVLAFFFLSTDGCIFFIFAQKSLFDTWFQCPMWMREKKVWDIGQKQKKWADISNFICAQRKIIYSCAKVVGTQYNQPTPTKHLSNSFASFQNTLFSVSFCWWCCCYWYPFKWHNPRLHSSSKWHRLKLSTNKNCECDAMKTHHKPRRRSKKPNRKIA